MSTGWDGTTGSTAGNVACVEEKPQVEPNIVNAMTWKQNPQNPGSSKPIKGSGKQMDKKRKRDSKEDLGSDGDEMEYTSRSKEKERAVSFGDFHLFLLLYFFLSRSTLLTINLLQLHGSIVVLDVPWLVPYTCCVNLFT